MILTLSLLTLSALALIQARRRHRDEVCFANIGEGTHDNSVTKKTDAAIATRFLLLKFGTDANHVAVCGAADIPLGNAEDEASAAEKLIAVQLLGIKQGTLLMVASEAISAGEHVYAAANGKIQDLPAGAGTYWEVGLAITAAAADNDLVEVAHCVPRKVVVP